MEKIYRIKIDNLFYVKAIMFGASEDEDFIQFIPTIDITEAGWYPEDKAEFYCKELNENKKSKEVGLTFQLERIEWQYNETN